MDDAKLVSMLCEVMADFRGCRIEDISTNYIYSCLIEGAQYKLGRCVLVLETMTKEERYNAILKMNAEYFLPIDMFVELEEPDED